MQFKWEFFFFFWHFEPNVFRKTRCLSNGLVYDSYFSEFTYFNIVLYAGRTFFSLANTTQQNDQKPNYKKKKKKKKNREKKEKEKRNQEDGGFKITKRNYDYNNMCKMVVSQNRKYWRTLLIGTQYWVVT
jgi:hypothetical protein